MPWQQRALVLATGVLAGLTVSTLILIAAGVPTGELFNEFVVGTVLDSHSLQATLFQAAPLIMVGLAASVAFRAGFWNLGLEGQMIFGAIAATAVSLFEIGPEQTRLGLMFAFAATAGLAWSAGPLALKLKLGVNEIIATLMLNYVAGNFLLHLLYGAWKDPKDAFPYSPQFRVFERLPGWLGNAGLALAVALTAMLIVWWWVTASRAGFYLRFVNANAKMARVAGVPVSAVVVVAVLASGALAGIAGFLVAVGQEGRLTQAFYLGYGLSGVLIAFLAQNHPVAATIVAVLVAALSVAGRNLQVFYQIPFSMVQLIQAIVVIAVASSDFFIRHRVRAVGIGSA